MEYLKCECGEVATLQHTIECGMSRWFMKCDNCGRMSDTFITPENAKKQWQSTRKFQTCITCTNFKHGICKVNDTISQPTWTCPKHQTESEKTLQDEIEKKTHSLNNDLLNTTFGMNPMEELDNLLGNYKITEKGELMTEVDRLESELQKQNDWWNKEFNILYEKYEKETDNYEKMLEEVRSKLWKAEDEIKYWTGEYNKVVQENEKYKMAFDRLWDIVEDMK